ncbi:hypothetical protein [Enterococcus sp. CWB-B31]|uniref:hypothetical protein n=1 Tax=Enterococcus sp. CWB-B31 TaxID=2885159 RepID=UPI001E2B9322|nr:hypothetical protein [Enterococcus sp. CWB-B31]MCB5955584.1 hypothetical protein [Enterococcus sp. CWB-B31]
MNKKVLKSKLVPSAMSLVLLSSFLVPNTVAFAETNATGSAVAIEQVNDLPLLDGDAKEIYDEVAVQNYLAQAQEETGFNVNQINPESVETVAEELGIDTTGDEISLSDKQLVQLLKSQGADIKQVPSKARAAGVTKIVKRGNGSWDIYLSASFIRDYYWYAAAATVIGCLAPGIGWSLAFAVIGLVAAYVERSTNHGYVVAIRNWRLSTIWRQ